LSVGAADDSTEQNLSLYPDIDIESDQMAQIRRNWDLDSISFALGSGFYDVAWSLSERLLNEDLGQDERESVLEYQFQIALTMGDLLEAQTIHTRMLEEEMVPDPLMSAFLAYFTGNSEEAAALLQDLEESELSSENRAWKELFEALLLSDIGDTEAANTGFLLAERLAPTALLRDHFEIIRLRKELSAGSSDDEVISALRESVRSMEGERGGFEAARLLATALNRRGFDLEAIEILSAQLAMPGLTESGLRPDFLLLLGMIAGPDSPRGRLALQQLISEGQGGEIQSLALALLAASTSSADEKEAFLLDLATWLTAIPTHPLADRLLAYQAFLQQSDNAFLEAESSASLLLERYPTSPFISTALRILAYTSWNQTPPRFRTAAEYLNRLREQLSEAEEILQTGILIADCYFLNGDYSSASEGYGAVLKDATPHLAQGIFFQQVLSELKTGNAEAAAAHIDAAYSDARIILSSIWKAEWNLIDFLRREGRITEAFARIENVMGGSDSENIQPELSLRMRYISARLSLESAYPEEALLQARTLIEELDGNQFSALPGELLQSVESHLLLLIGESYYAEGQKSEGIGTFLQLREKFPQSGPAILSYLVESRAESGEDNLVSAQRSLIDLVDRFPESEYAPIALWEAALNAEQRGLNSHLQEAIRILEDLVIAYPEHGLVYFARLKQGDLARRLNDFPTALLLYERLLSIYPGHPERFRAEISRGDCLMALGSEDPSRLDVAAIIYQRNCLLSSAPLSIRLEAGFKWANALLQQDDFQGSDAVYLQLYERFILDPDMNQHILTEEAGRYWMARVLLQMGNQQSEKGETAAAVTLYQTLISLDLPGSALAQARLDALR